MFRQTRNVQAVWFFHGEIKNHSELFKRLAGQDPDAFQRITPPQAPFPVVVYQAMIEGKQHRLQSYFGRVDYFIEAAPVAGPEFSSVGLPLDIIKNIVSRVAVAHEFTGKIARAAIVANLFEEVTSSEQSEKFFESLTGGKSFNDSRDAVIQLNKRGKTSSCGINRLLRWSVENVQFEQFVPGPNGAEFRVASKNTQYLTYMIDVNTFAETDLALEGSSQTSVFSEIANEVQNLATLEKLEMLR